MDLTMLQHATYHWAVVGAGPAGIAALGQLLDAEINPQQIIWLDPHFKVGDFGTSWKHVLSNTPVESFIKFYQAFDSFAFKDRPKPFLIERIQPEKTCPLMLAAEPMHMITQTLQNKVTAIYDTVLSMQQTPGGWCLNLKNQSITAKKVILALGGEALTLPFSHLTTIPLKTAASPTLLQQMLNPSDTIAVFGSYQSARTVQTNLAKTNVGNIIHFYRSERSFEQHVASLNLDNRVRSYAMHNANLLKYIPECNKAIYAVGFQRRTLDIAGLPHDFAYDYQTGTIASGVYGLGMAFPEIIPYMLGRLEYKVSAIWPFTRHLKKIFPQWLLV